MPDYTHTNLKDLDDLAAGRGMDIEARFGRKHIDSDHLGVSYFRYGADVRPAYGHRHSVQEEAYVVVSGSGQMRLGDKTIELKQWDVVRVAPHVLRGIKAGTDGIEMIVVGSDRPEEGDGEMVRDFWPE
jgi:quercetin dioxygenase-like cupin family protein